MATKSISRKHHYLPQAYLAAFTNTGTKNGQLCVLDLEDGRAFSTSPINLAAERDFNRVDIEGHSIDAIENALASFEGNAVNSIRKVINSHNFPNDEDWNLIINLLALIAIRNPQRRRSFNIAREQEIEIIGDLLAKDENMWNSQVKAAREAGEHIPEVTFGEFKSFIEKREYKCVFPSQDNLRVEFSALDALLPLLGQRTWSVLLAPTDGPEFICSDHPVTLMPKYKRDGLIGYGIRETEVFFPLGRRVGFYGVFESPLNPVVNCKPENVARMNAQVMKSADRHVYSALDTFSVWTNGAIEKVLCEHKFN